MPDISILTGFYTGDKPVHSGVGDWSGGRPVAPDGSSLSRRLTVPKSFADNGNALTIAETDFSHVYVDTSGGATTLILPTVGASENGMSCVFKRLGANDLIVNGAGLQIDGAASHTLSNDKETVELVYVHDETEWHVLTAAAVGGSGSSLWTSLGGVISPTGGESVQIPVGTWNGAHMIMGTYHFWNDTSGRLRIKSGAPTSDIDGDVVGQQS